MPSYIWLASYYLFANAIIYQAKKVKEFISIKSILMPGVLLVSETKKPQEKLFSRGFKLLETFARKYGARRMSVIFHIFHKNKGNSRAIGRIFMGNMGYLSHFLSVISFVQRSLLV